VGREEVSAVADQTRERPARPSRPEQQRESDHSSDKRHEWSPDDVQILEEGEQKPEK
jgi:hypothetical protein